MKKGGGVMNAQAEDERIRAWYRSAAVLYGASAAAGFFFGYCVFSGSYSIPVWLGRLSLFLISVPFLVFGFGLRFLEPVNAYLMMILCGVYFAFVLFAFFILKDALSRRRLLVLAGFTVMLWGMHAMADRIMTIYIGESVRNTAPDIPAASSHTPAGLETADPAGLQTSGAPATL